MMKQEIMEFRDGIFALSPRKFTAVTELMIEALHHHTKRQNQYHARYEEVGSQPLEVKFSTVLKAQKDKISMENVVKRCIKANLGNRALKSSETNKHGFSCSIRCFGQPEIGVLFYGLFFSDRIGIFKMRSEERQDCRGYTQDQENGGHLALNHNNIDTHFRKHFMQWFSYEELYELFSNQQ